MYIERYATKSQILMDGFSKPCRSDKNNIAEELRFILGTKFRVSSYKKIIFQNNVECVAIELISQNASECFVKHITCYP